MNIHPWHAIQWSRFHHHRSNVIADPILRPLPQWQIMNSPISVDCDHFAVCFVLVCVADHFHGEHISEWVWRMVVMMVTYDLPLLPVKETPSLDQWWMLSHLCLMVMSFKVQHLYFLLIPHKVSFASQVNFRFADFFFLLVTSLMSNVNEWGEKTVK